MGMHQTAEFARLAFLQRFLDAHAKILGVMHVFEHLAVILLGALILVLQDIARLAGKTGEEQQQVIFQFEERVHFDRQRVGIHRIIRMEFETGSRRRDVRPACR